ncbi:MAG: alanine racemase, partial [Chloroflexi bacterium]|nr:alanine racemase [Chloroflexota bacterium]
MLSLTVPPNEFLATLSVSAPSTPSLLIDLTALEADFQAFRSAFPTERICYAVKANPHPAVLRRLADLSCDFEISSLGELRLLQELSMPGQRIISSNPVKAPAFIAAAYAYGLRHFAFDSDAELEKLVELAPEAELALRLTVPNTESEWPLDKKFGVDGKQAIELMLAAHSRGLKPTSVTFHVGSQCTDEGAWIIALEKVAELWTEAKNLGLPLHVVNIGGGMPVAYTDPDVPTLPMVAQAVRSARDRLSLGDAEVWLEPGRGVVGRSGVLLCSVLGVADRNGTRWVYLDAGIFHGLTEAMGGISYRLVSVAPGP